MRVGAADVAEVDGAASATAGRGVDRLIRGGLEADGFCSGCQISTARVDIAFKGNHAAVFGRVQRQIEFACRTGGDRTIEVNVISRRQRGGDIAGPGVFQSGIEHQVFGYRHREIGVGHHHVVGVDQQVV